jgi:hypothetical protein
MDTIRACNAQEMYERMRQIDKKICELSAEAGLLFRERMQAVLAEAPRIGTANSVSGVFAVEEVWRILRDASVVLHARGLDFILQENITQ